MWNVTQIQADAMNIRTQPLLLIACQQGENIADESCLRTKNVLVGAIRYTHVVAGHEVEHTRQQSLDSTTVPPPQIIAAGRQPCTHLRGIYRGHCTEEYYYIEGAFRGHTRSGGIDVVMYAPTSTTFQRTGKPPARCSKLYPGFSSIRALERDKGC